METCLVGLQTSSWFPGSHLRYSRYDSFVAFCFGKQLYGSRILAPLQIRPGGGLESNINVRSDNESFQWARENRSNRNNPAGCIGFVTFGMGVITAVFHWCGTKPSVVDWLRRLVRRAAKNGGSESQEPCWNFIDSSSRGSETVQYPKDVHFRDVLVRSVVERSAWVTVHDNRSQ